MRLRRLWPDVAWRVATEITFLVIASRLLICLELPVHWLCPKYPLSCFYFVKCFKLYWNYCSVFFLQQVNCVVTSAVPILPIPYQCFSLEHQPILLSMWYQYATDDTDFNDLFSSVNNSRTVVSPPTVLACELQSRVPIWLKHRSFSQCCCLG